MKKVIYLDNAATTKVRPEVVEAMLPFYTEYYGNPSAVYEFSTPCKEALAKARETVANSLGAKDNEIYFTNGGSESDNWALIATAEAYASKGKHIITTKIEHHAILHTCEYLKKRGYEITYLPVDEFGTVSIDELKKAIRPDTILISVMFANNEIGSIQPIKEIGAIAKEHGILFHTDAVQAVGHIPVDVKEMNIDMLSMSGHKFHGPKGIGALYARKGILLTNIIEGGAQERKKRAGTENMPGIVGMAAALVEATENLDKNMKYVTSLRNKLVDGLKGIEKSRLNGNMEHHLPGTLNMCFEGTEGEGILLWLDQKGVEASSGSACTSGSLDPSHVLLAIGVPVEIAHGSLRLSISEFNTEEEIDHIIKVVPEVVTYLRGMSPVWERMMKEEK